MALSEVLESAVDIGADLGQLGTLQPYERARHPDTVAMMAVLNTFAYMFRGEPGVFSAFRNAGMGVLNALGPVKSLAAKYAMDSGTLQRSLFGR